MTTFQPEDSGTFFVFPPHHRLFAVFDDPAVGNEVAAELRAEGVNDDVWTFFGAKGIETLEPHAGHHGVPVAIVRVFQRLMTSDCDYCAGLALALRRGAMVLAIRVEDEQVDELSERLRLRGGHSFAYGAHWNFVPLRGAGHAIGFISSEESGQPVSRS